MKTTKDRKKSDRSYSKKSIKNPLFLRFYFHSIDRNKEKSQKKGKTACLITRGLQRCSGKHRQAKSIFPYNFLKIALKIPYASARLETHVQTFYGMCQGTYRNEVDTTLGIVAQRIKCNTTR